MNSPNGLYEWLALGGAAGALVVLVLVSTLLVTVRKLRKAQRLVLGDSERDVVAHAESMQREFLSLRDWLEDATGKVERRIETVESRLDNAVLYRSMLRYDAYGEMSGRQSSTVALLDSHKSGIVLSSILHRNHSHVYVKQIVAGESEIELSPEEQQAVDLALAGKQQPSAEPVSASSKA